MIKNDLHIDRIRKTYAGIFAALERAGEEFKFEFYLGNPTSKIDGKDRVNALNSNQAGIEFSVFVNDYSVWNDVVKYITKKENFYQDKNDVHLFYLRGTCVQLIPVYENGILHCENSAA